jgi:hypothetical protein
MKEKQFQNEASPLQILNTMIILRLLFQKSGITLREMTIKTGQLKVFSRLAMKFILCCVVTMVHDKVFIDMIGGILY